MQENKSSYMTWHVKHSAYFGKNLRSGKHDALAWVKVLVENDSLQHLKANRI